MGKSYYVTYSGSTVVEAENEYEACELGVDNLSLDEVNAYEVFDNENVAENVVESIDDSVFKDDQPIYIYGYDFSEGDKGIVIASSIEEAEGKIRDAYGEEYWTGHSLCISLAGHMGNDVFCTEDTWQ